ncbi:MAG: ATP-binding protein [Alphaproteobacteria bacterium]|nr:ATP-binding protein [Alphaproteobacteria bacterium]
MTNPLNTLTGRMVAVTIVAVIISYAVAFAIFTNERGAALRRAAEIGVAERVAFTAERLRGIPVERRDIVADSIRDFSMRFDVSATPDVDASLGGAATRISNAIDERLADGDARTRTRTVDAPSHRWRSRGEHGDRGRGRGRGRGGPDRDDEGPPPGSPPSDPPAGDHLAQHEGPLVRVTEAAISVRLDDATWLNATARLPGPRPAPISAIVGALVSIVIVGIGAALVSRQIGRPLSDLANAARALGSGQTNVSAPVSGPEDVRRASTAFNVMAERLGRQLSRQRQMLWALSHDLRTPITAIRLRAELIEDEAERQRLLASVAEMETLTEQALSLARAGASEEARSNVDLAEIARTLCGELQDMGVNICAEANEPLMAECRPTEMARAMRNLAENAAKYGGGGIMRAYRNDANEAVVEVLDDGPGVPPDLLARITAPFFRADEARSQTRGAGLGLAITQAIADSHGGRLVLENRTPKGFSAKLVLPN